MRETKDIKKEYLASTRKALAVHSKRAEAYALDHTRAGQALGICHAAMAKKCGKQVEQLEVDIEDLTRGEHHTKRR